jgi:hypothetical protein
MERRPASRNNWRRSWGGWESKSDDWLELATNFGRPFHRIAGHRSAVERERTRRGDHFGLGRCQLFGRG